LDVDVGRQPDVGDVDVGDVLLLSGLGGGGTVCVYKSKHFSQHLIVPTFYLFH
jgi:hypothetical protein